LGNSIAEPSDSQPQYKTIAEIADQLQLSEQTIRRYIRDGRITAHRVGPRRLLLDPQQVTAQLLTRKTVQDCPPLTADEASLIQQSVTLDRMILDSTDDDRGELQRRRDAVLVAIRDSRLQTWDQWLTTKGA
jgi:excisionase family DNA binding protein